MGDQTSQADAEPQVKHPSFKAAYETGVVPFGDLVVIAAMREHPDEARREIAHHDYPLLYKKFLKKHEDAEIAIQSWAAIGACLNAGHDGVLELIVVRNSLRFQWQSARALP